MSPVSSIGSPLASLYGRVAAPAPPPPTLPGAAAAGGVTTAPTGASFANVFDQLVSTVEGKQADANAATRQVLLGEQGQLHQSVIAMQEASVAFSLMVQVRNKVVESYQELMRMPV
jgi:flagellar hook-basal body complex protein FliE